MRPLRQPTAVQPVAVKPVAGRSTARLRPAAVVAALGLTLALTACGGPDVSFTGAGSTQAATSATDGDQAGTAPSSAPASDSDAAGAIRLPEFPAPRVPDIASMTADAEKTQKAIAADLELPAGLQVTGARCDSSGDVVNRSGLTVGAGDDGSSVASRAGTSQVSADGSGQVSSKTLTIQVDADGSGQMSTRDATVQVDADGSGQYSDPNITYQVDSDGSGQYSNASETYQVSADGSGQWNGPAGTVHNSGDGSGDWIGQAGIVTVNGDGTGDLNGNSIAIAPMPKFALLGKLPKLNTLKPIGKPCGTLIRISAGLLFDFDKATIRPEAKPVLAAVAKALAGSSADLQVNGHTDAKGTDAYNLDLSQRRAQAVVAALTAAGLSAPMTPTGFGEAQPVAPNTLGGKDNPVGRQLNRRVEIVIPNG
jgi:OOP family OmpA-OmpF porin